MFHRVRNCIDSFFLSREFLGFDSGILTTIRPRDQELKGVRDGDTGLFAAGNCFRKKISRERQARVEDWHGIVPQAVDNEYCLGLP